MHTLTSVKPQGQTHMNIVVVDYLIQTRLIAYSPVGWVHLVEGPADLQGGPIIFSNSEEQENKREQGGGSTLAGGPGPYVPPTLRG